MKNKLKIEMKPIQVRWRNNEQDVELYRKIMTWRDENNGANISALIRKALNDYFELKQAN